MKRFLIIVSILIIKVISLWAVPIPANVDIVVAWNGTGNYTTIQAAVNAVPNNSSSYTLIYIKNGVYEESVNIPSNKRNVIFFGEDNLNTVISYKTEQTLDLATLQVYATGFIAYNITIENTAGPTYGPAQALRQEADKSIYIGCRLIGNQDTYRTARVRSYSKNCYYEGTVDFIFGNGSIVFEDCDIYSKGGTAITAASTDDYINYGYVFRNCRVVSKKGSSTHLGRPWKDYAAVAFINCELPDEIIDAGWHNWDKPERELTSRFAEYRNYGPGADTSKRVNWVTLLTPAEVEQYNTLNVLKATMSSSPVVDNWNPYEVIKSTNIPDLLEEGDGYGKNNGGNGGPTVMVFNENELKQYATSDSSYIIRVSGNIELSGRIDVGSNTTITGINEESSVSGGTLNITKGKNNVIIKYLNVTNPDGDGISVWDGHKVFITHVSFYDCGDGCCDINRGSDSVTLSWCKFYYPNQEDHRFTMIADGAMTWDNNGVVTSYGNKLNLTLHHNWWYQKSHERMPSSTNTNAHMYNNYWNCIDNYYCSNARHLTEFYSEYNYYDNVNNPIYNSEADGKIYTNGNIYNNCDGDISAGTNSVFVPGYPYILTTTNDVPYIVTSRAGNVWGNPPKYTLVATTDGHGSVSVSGTNVYNEGQLVTLEATPFKNYKFLNWTGKISNNDNPLVFYMDTNYIMQANFDSLVSIVENNVQENDLLIYPNPNYNGKFFIMLPKNYNKESTVKILNITGKTVYENHISYQDGLLAVNSNLQSGVYVLVVILNSDKYTKIIGVQ